MATIKFLCSSSKKIDDIPFQAGQIIFVQDERAIYVDGTERTSYQQIITLSTEAQRQALFIPLKGFYFIQDTKILWQYTGEEWIQVTSSPEKQVVFDKKENFPEPGDFAVIYVDGLDMYRYIDDRYQLMNNASGGSIWEPI